MVLVIVILFLFLGNVRGAIIVSLTIPFALLFASICLEGADYFRKSAFPLGRWISGWLWTERW